MPPLLGPAAVIMSQAAGGPPPGAPTLVQPPVSNFVDVASPSLSVVISGVTAGSTLVCAAPCRDTAPRTLVGFSDDVNGAWTTAQDARHSSDNSLLCMAASFENSAAVPGDLTVTLTMSGNTAILSLVVFELTEGSIVEVGNFSNAPAQANPQFCAQVGGINSAGNPAFGVGYIVASGNAFHGPKTDWIEINIGQPRLECYYREEPTAFVAERCTIDPTNESRTNFGSLFFVR